MTTGLDDGVATPSDDEPIYSPWSAAEAPGIQLIVLMRIYDVLMAQYTLAARVAHSQGINHVLGGPRQLMDLHAQGGLIGSLPFFDPSLIQGEDDDDDEQLA